MHRDIGPLLVVGAIVAVATTVVVNPVVVPSTDIRVSSTDLAAGHSDLDLLNRAFVASAPAVPSSGTEAAGPNFDSLFPEVKSAKPRVDPVSLTDPIASDPVLAMSVLAVTPISLSPGGQQNTSSPANTAGLLRAIAVIGAAFGQGGTAFIEQVGMSPEMISGLADAVQAGGLAPEVAIRKLAAASLNVVVAGPPGAAANSIIDEVFNEDELAPVVDEITEIAQPPVDHDAVMSAQTSGPSASLASQAPAEVAESPEESEIIEDPSAQRAAQESTESGNEIVRVSPPPRRNHVFRPDRVLSSIGERISERLKDFEERLARPQTPPRTGDTESDSGSELKPSTEPNTGPASAQP